MKLQFQKRKGMSLVELVVVLAIFIVIITAASGLFLDIAQNQRKILEQQELSNQVSYTLEYFSRLARTTLRDATGSCLIDANGTHYPGYDYLLTHYDASSQFYKGIKLISSDGVCHEFYATDDGVFKETKGGGTAQNLLSGAFKVNYVRFVINGNKALQGASVNDTAQPRITVVMDVLTQDKHETMAQATISQRNLNLQ